MKMRIEVKVFSQVRPNVPAIRAELKANSNVTLNRWRFGECMI
jgi:hypothetical protein